MANKKLEEYNRARNDGLRLALRIVEEGGLEALKKDLRFREKNRINTNLTMKELDEASEPMRGFINEGHILIWLSVLHDEFGFGKERLNRAMDRFEKIYSQINDGYAGYQDYVEMLQEKMKRILKVKYLVKDGHWVKDEGK